MLIKPTYTLIILSLLGVVFGTACQPATQVLNESEVSSIPTLSNNISVATLPPTRVTNPDCDPSKAPPIVPEHEPNESVKVAYLKGNNIWVWDESSQQAIPLTDTSDVFAYKPSPDRKLIAYTRHYSTGHELWVMDADGQNARLLVSVEELMLLQENPSHEIVSLGQWEWQPGKHVIAYAPHGLLHPYSEVFEPVLYEELYLIDVDTGERFPTLVIPNRFGDFQFSPDGNQIAAVTGFGISLLNSNGSNQRDFEMEQDPWYAGVGPISPHIYWSGDNTTLRTIFSTEDSNDSTGNLTTVLSVWEISSVEDITYSPSSLMQTQGFFPTAALSPDLKYLAAQDSSSEETFDIYGVESGEKIFTSPNKEGTWFNGWLPDSVQFTYSVRGKEANARADFFLTDIWNCSVGPIPQVILWINNSQYVYLKPILSEDGTFISNSELWLRTPAGGDVLVETGRASLVTLVGGEQ